MMQTSKVFFAVAMSLDGFIAPEGMELAHIHDPEYKQWTKKWMTLMHWVFQQKFFQYLNAGLIDEFTIHYVPVLFGQGTPLFANMNPEIKVKMREAVPSQEVAHITYEVEKE